MPRKTSAGILLYRLRPEPEFFLVHPGGPYWAKKDAGSWSIPKGEFTEGEVPFEAARREFEEETGVLIGGEFRELQPIRQPSGKIVFAWALEGDLDPKTLRSNLFELEWPPKSGQVREFPEVDRGEWFGAKEARKRILPGQVGFIDQLVTILGAPDLDGDDTDDPPQRSLF